MNKILLYYQRFSRCVFLSALVSSVQLVSECLSQGQMKVSCSSEGGDSPQYSWTLDGYTLTDTELLFGSEETNIITLKQHVSGRLVCSVRNHVSFVSKELMISVCRGKTEQQQHSLHVCMITADFLFFTLAKGSSIGRCRSGNNCLL